MTLGHSGYAESLELSRTCAIMMKDAIVEARAGAAGWRTRSQATKRVDLIHWRCEECNLSTDGENP